MRRLVLVAGVFWGLFGGVIAESQEVKFAVHRVAGNVYLLDDTGAGGGIPVLVGSEGLLVINGPREKDLQQFLAALRPISDKPVRYVIYTQCDAINEQFRPVGVTVIAHANARKRFERKKCDSPPDIVLPTLTFESELSLHFADEEVRLIKLPTGHSDNDAIVYFKSANVLATGDMFYGSGPPPGYTKYAGGNMLGIAEQLRTIVALMPEDVKILPGQGAPASMSDVRKTIQTLDAMKEAIASQVAKGKTLAQLREMDVLAPWKDVVTGPQRPNYLKFFYDCLTGPPDPKFQL